MALRVRFVLGVLVGGMMFSQACAHSFEGSRPIRWGHAEPQSLAPGKVPQHRKFVAMWPHFEQQHTDAACSVAASAIVLRALGAAPGAQLTHTQLLALDTSGQWARHTRQGGDGVDLDGLGLHLIQALFALGERRVTVDVVHMAPDAENTLQVALRRGEEADDAYIIINARQDLLFAGGERVGHFVVVAGWDEARGRILVLDPDYETLPPYWVSLDRALAAMNTRDDGVGLTRGFVTVRTAR